MKLKLLGFTDKAEKKESEELIDSLFGNAVDRNKYYRVCAGICRVLEFTCLFALIVFVAVSATVNTGKITRENADYIIRNFAFKLDENTETHSEIIYSPDQGQTFALFGKGLAIGGNSGIRIFSATGRNTCSDDFSLTASRLASSGKYAAVYEYGGSDYYVYNSFSSVYHGVFDGTIYGMSVSDSGSYILITDDEEYISSVGLYRSNFSLATRYRKNSYVISAELNKAGDGLLITTLDVNSSGQYSVVIELFRTGEDAAAVTERITSVFPMKCFFTADGFGLLCKDRVLLYRNDGTLKRETKFEGLTAVNFDCGESSAAVILEETGTGLSVNYYLLLSDTSDGGKDLRTKLEFTPVSLSVYGSNAYILSGTGDGRVDVYSSNGREAYIEVTGKPQGRAVLAYEDGKIYYLCNSSAYALNIDLAH